MEISVLVYKNKDRASITKINHDLFGRLVRMKNSVYYYSGKLENILHYKATNGCYFIIQDENNRIIETDLYYVYPILIEKQHFSFKTAKEHWKEHCKKINMKIKNLDI